VTSETGATGTTAATRRTGSSTSADILTPTVRTSARRSLFWVGAAIFALLIAVIGILLGGQSGPRDFLDGDSPAPDGAQAALEVLRDRGVSVTTTHSLTATTEAITSRDNTTIALYDRDYILDDDQRDILYDLADTFVLIEPTFDDLDIVAPSVAQAGVVDTTLDADCAVEAVKRAGSVSGDGVGYRVLEKSPDIEACFGSGDDVFSLIRIESDARTVTIVGTSEAFSNGIITDNGNAALALNVLGENDNLIWYVPGLSDLAGDYPPTLGDLSPAWVTSVTTLLALTALAAAFWRGRRFGPLVIENLPVTVRSSETMQGRARLYEKSSARLHALDAIRMGTISRLATQCGLSSLASVDDVVATIASITGQHPTHLRELLVDAAPHHDAELVSLSDSLLELEADVRNRLRPE
jgi:hypothetical protein